MIFISHASADINAIRKIAKDLRLYDIDFWLDEDEILFGDSIPLSISKAINNAKYLLVFFSKNTEKNNWIQEEWATALMKEHLNSTIKVIPARLDFVPLPPILSHRKCFDIFGDDYSLNLEKLVQQLKGKPTVTINRFDLLKQFLRSDRIDKLNKIVIPPKLFFDVKSDAHLGIITLENRAFLFPEEAAIQFAIVCENRFSIEAISSYTQISKERIWQIVTYSPNFNLNNHDIYLTPPTLPKLIIFDWRKTLVEEDSFDDALCVSIPRNKEEAKEYHKWLKDLFDKKDRLWYDYLQHCLTLGLSFKDFKRVHYENSRYIHLFPGVQEYLFKAKIKGIKTAIATNASPSTLDLRMQLLDLKPDLFDLIVSGDSTDETGLKIELLLKVIEEFNFPPDEIAIISDSLEKDIIPAKNLGLKTIWIFSPRQEVERPWGHPDLLVPSNVLNIEIAKIGKNLPFDYIITQFQQINKIWRLD